MENKQKPSLTGMTKKFAKVANKNQITFIEYQLIHGPTFHWAKYFIKFCHSYLQSILGFRAVIHNLGEGSTFYSGYQDFGDH